MMEVDIKKNGAISEMSPHGDEPVYFKNGFEHIQMELARLDLYIRRFVYAFRASLVAGGVVPAPGYISNEEIDALLNRACDLDYDDEALTEINKAIQSYDEKIDLWVANSYINNISLPLVQISKQFNLTWLEYQALLVCLAPELKHRYDKFYAYLQDDISRKKPSVDFILNLFSQGELEQWQARAIFSSGAPLMRHELLESSDDPQSPSGSSGLARFLKLDERVLNYILDIGGVDARLDGLLTIEYERENPISTDGCENDRQSLLPLIQHYVSSRSEDTKNLILHVSGPMGVGKRKLVSDICSHLRCPLLLIDMERLLKKNSNKRSLLKYAFRESLFCQGVLYIENIDSLLEEASEYRFLLQEIDRFAREYGWLTFVGSVKSQRLIQVFQFSFYHFHEMKLPDEQGRCLIWKENLKPLVADKCALDQYAALLSERYRLSPGMIQSACETAQLLTLQKQGGVIDIDDLMRICRSQSGQGLSSYAKKIKSHYVWDDLILPLETKQVLRNICHQVSNENKVFNQWNFSEKLQYGRGLSILYSGPPGTGKTMSAQVIANELKIDLYKIDLSGVVSKYIGETEKNLNRIFEEAENCNAILFFDEADALFGKRTEVSDAHDRYANIEVSYLLQKMEEYNGIVILATNLRGNIDNAFTRRIRFIIEFPFPDAQSRMQIWKNNVPKEAPLQDDVDFDYLSSRVKVSGASIKNIVLNAAFYAAQHDRNIDMHCLSYSIEQEYRKIGKLWVANDLNDSDRKTKTVRVKHG